MINLRPLGDRAFLARFVCESTAQRWAESVRSRAIPGVLEVTVAYASAAVYVDPDQGELNGLLDILQSIEPAETNQIIGRLIRLPVLYDGEDLAEVSRLAGLTEPEVINRHSSVDYTVFAIGFLPGFPYAGYLSEPLASVPRLSSPRVKVPGGSVAIAARQTGVYPMASPGGWRLLGRTPLKLIDLDLGDFPIRAGDRLRFEPIGLEEYFSRLGEPIGLAE